MINGAIDVHGHIGCYDIGKGKPSDKWMSGTPEEVIRRARMVGIRITIVSPLEALMPHGGNPLSGNENARKAAEKYEELFFWAVLNPKLKDSLKQVEKLLNHPKCAGIKVHPVLHSYEIGKFGDKIFEFASSRKSVIISHSGCPRSFPQKFLPFANKFPDVRLILSHLGNDPKGDMTLQVSAIKCARRCNVFTDTSSMKSIVSNIIEWTVKEVGTDRILFGTDTPLYFSPAQKARIDFANIPVSAKRAILFKNAERILKLNTKRLKME